MSAGIILAVIAVVAIPLMLFAMRVAGAGKPGKARNADDVARYLRNALDDDPSADEWSDFISVRIKDAKLDAIRQEAERINFPLERSDEAQLRALLKRAEAAER